MPACHSGHDPESRSSFRQRPEQGLDSGSRIEVRDRLGRYECLFPMKACGIIQHALTWMLGDYTFLEGIGRRNRYRRAASVDRIEHAAITQSLIRALVHDIPTPNII